MGLPVTKILAAGKKDSIPNVPVNIFIAFLESHVLALPAKALDSCIKVGMFFVCAYFKTGKLE